MNKLINAKEQRKYRGTKERDAFGSAQAEQEPPAEFEDAIDQ
jgi:hypothetical protein